MNRILPPLTLIALLSLALSAQADQPPAAAVSGELKQWHAVTLTFDGPTCREDGTPNPFTDYRLSVLFTKGETACIVPGYFAADGNAAESGAQAGNKWRAHFVPNETGQWEYKVSFHTGPNVATDEAAASQPAAFDGLRGKFDIAPSDKPPTDGRGKGLLRYVGQRYLRYAGTGEVFLKGGADSPENFLGYADFDGTSDIKGEPFLHRYQAHEKDWRASDPTWRDGKGKGIIGALNYLAGAGMNSVYFLPYNIDGGDGGDTWPWTDPQTRDRFDCSKLDQWEIVFSHMDRLGIALHVVTQETENDQALDGGGLGPIRKLYYRELIARFGHHLALVWNLGEENTNTDEQRKAFASYIRRLDPYAHPIVVHTYPGQKEAVYPPLLGAICFEGPSLQMGGVEPVHAETIKWLEASAKAGRPWFVCIDEWGGADVGAKPDADDPAHDDARRLALWGNLMAGGSGVEWYFGYKFAHGDLNCEDWRSRENLWAQTRIALEFFRRHLPVAEMVHADQLVSAEGAHCLARPACDVYAIYLPAGGTTNVMLPAGEFEVKWLNPRRSGPLQAGSVERLEGPGAKPIGPPPAEPQQDWAVWIKKVDTTAKGN